MLPGGVSALRGCLLLGSVCFPGGGVSAWVGLLLGVCSGGMSAPGGCLLPGGVCS